MTKEDVVDREIVFLDRAAFDVVLALANKMHHMNTKKEGYPAHVLEAEREALNMVFKQASASASAARRAAKAASDMLSIISLPET